MFIAIAVILVFGHSAQADFETDLRRAVEKAENATLALKLSVDSVGSEELSIIKNVTTGKVLECVKHQFLPYNMMVSAVNASPEAKDIFKKLTSPAFLRLYLIEPTPTNRPLELKKVEYNQETMKLVQVEFDRKMFVKYPTPTTRSMLGEECDQSVPRQVAVWLHREVVQNSTLYDVLLISIQNNLSVWRAWSRHILTDFVTAMSLSQVCAGFDRRDVVGKYNKTALITSQLKDYEEVFDKLIQGETRVKRGAAI